MLHGLDSRNVRPGHTLSSSWPLLFHRGLIQSRGKVLCVVAMREPGARKETLDDTPLPKSFDGELGVQRGAPLQGEVTAQNPKVPFSHHRAAAELFYFSKN